MDAGYWPLEGLRVVAGPVELRHPTPQDLVVFADEAAHESYSPSVPMFAVRDDTPAERGRRTLQFHWQQMAAWGPARWSLLLSVLHEGEVVGSVNMRAHDFAELREVATGSWIFKRRQGEGLGTQARAALVHLAFEGLGADYALSAVAEDNPASRRVSEKLGYRPDGTTRMVAEGEVVTLARLRLDARRWRELNGGSDVRVHGLDACLPMFGIG